MRTCFHRLIGAQNIDAARLAHKGGILHRLIISLGAIVYLSLAIVSFAAGHLPGFPRHVVTNASGFASLTASDYLDGCNFQLTGLVTLVDQRRDLLVLQDETGAVALHFPLENTGLRFGQCVSLTGSNCLPYVQRFPAYPFRPSRRESLPAFEVLPAEGEYYLSRMRAYLTPPHSGEYTFWIASDNSSELWLSTDDSPSKSQKIASISRFEWASPREWSRYPSQRSVPISLQAGRTYYIEAIHEQTTQEGHLAVAWRGPELDQAVIENIYLTSFDSSRNGHPENGVTRDVWTNFMAGTLSGVSGPHSFNSMLSVETVAIRELSDGRCRKPVPEALDERPWNQDRNFRWVSFDGLVTFVGNEESTLWLSLRGNGKEVQVCSPAPEPAQLRRLANSRIQVEGVCEGIYDANDEWKPGIIWVQDAGAISITSENVANDPSIDRELGPLAPPVDDTLPKQGFYTMRGVVTFNDCVAGVNYLVVQEGESAKMVSGGEAAFFSRYLNVGDWIGLGGALKPGKDIPMLAPLTISELGKHAMPVPISSPLTAASSPNEAGRWCEFTGVPHSMNSNAMLLVVNSDGALHVWVGETSSDELEGWIDSSVRVQGIFLPNAGGMPRILVPSKKFVDVRNRPPANPFDKPASPIAHVTHSATQRTALHRFKIAGEITYQDGCVFVVQDHSGAVRIHQPQSLPTKIGDSVEVVGFASRQSSGVVMSDVLVRREASNRIIQAAPTDFAEGPSSRQDATLIESTGTLLARKVAGDHQILELLGPHRVFTATLPENSGSLPTIEIGSRLKVVGICEGDWNTGGMRRNQTQGTAAGTLNLLLRTPADLTILSGPPWWTRTRVVVLTSTLALVIAATLLRIRLLQRKLKREQAMQLAFSQHVLGKLEEERSRIAGNLHDSLGQALLIIRNRALTAMQSASDEQQFREHATQISEATCQAIEEVRQIAQGLHPSLLDRLGLTEAIRACINLASENSSILFASRVDGIDGLFPKDAEIHLFRIVQEAVTNVVKHSEATEAAVVIKKGESVIAVSVRDNGSGFDPSECPDSGRDIGYGLVGIRNRSAILGGTFTIDSRPGEGTRLTVEAPFQESTVTA